VCSVSGLMLQGWSVSGVSGLMLEECSWIEVRATGCVKRFWIDV
jgi:hypothetical protein